MSASVLVWRRHLQTQSNESNVSWIYLVPTWIVCPDTEKWPISAKFDQGGDVCSSHQQCADSQTETAEEGIIRITHTNIQIHTSTHQYLCTDSSNTLHQTWEIVSTPACTQKKKERVTWLILSNSNRAWHRAPLSCWTGEHIVVKPVKAKYHRDSVKIKKRHEKLFDDNLHLRYTYMLNRSSNTRVSTAIHGMNYYSVHITVTTFDENRLAWNDCFRG